MAEAVMKKKTDMFKSKVWDCESCLYDSFELKSFNRQLDSAISRTLSMPRISEVSVPAPRPVKVSPSTMSPRWISRSFHRIIRSVFRLKPGVVLGSRVVERPVEVHYFMYHSTGDMLPTIPERWEQGGDFLSMSPEFDSPAVRKTVSERFTGRVVAGISACA